MKPLNVNINGNKKLQNSENIRFMIWNLPAVKTCPFRTAHCEKSCYARKAERVYPNVLPSREKNFSDSLSGDFVGNMIFTIDHYLNSKAFSGKKCAFRIHESGDFYNLEYAGKWVEIAKHFEKDDRIVFVAYTKSIIYMINCGYGLSNFPKNLIIRSSIWDDTREDLTNLTQAYNFPIYTALTAEDMEKERDNCRKFSVCTCESCSTCGKCWDASERDIIVKIH